MTDSDNHVGISLGTGEGKSPPAIAAVVPEWKAIPGFPGYEASHRGFIRSIDRVAGGRQLRGRVLKARVAGTAPYPIVNLTDDQGVKQTRTVHSLVLLAHAGPCPPGMQAEHRHDNPLDNRYPEELFWSTKSANEKRKFENGRPKPVPPPRAPKECRNFERCGNHITPGTGTRCEHCRAEFSRGCALLLAEGMDPEEVGRRMEYPALGTYRMAVKYGGLIVTTGDALAQPSQPSPGVMATLRHIVRLGRR